MSECTLNTGEVVKRGTMLRDKRAKYTIYYSVRRVTVPSEGNYAYVGILRMRSDGRGMSVGPGKATAINMDSGKLIGFTVVRDEDIPGPMRQWCETR